MTQIIFVRSTLGEQGDSGVSPGTKTPKIRNAVPTRVEDDTLFAGYIRSETLRHRVSGATRRTTTSVPTVIRGAVGKHPGRDHVSHTRYCGNSSPSTLI